jgi:hypothetical protein
MAELARAHRIRMVFASVLPVHNYTHDAEESFALRPRARILALNKWLKDYCAKNRLVYLDYFSALVDEVCCNALWLTTGCTRLMPGIGSWRP